MEDAQQIEVPQQEKKEQQEDNGSFKSADNDSFKSAEEDKDTQDTDNKTVTNAVSNLFLHKIENHGELKPFPGSRPEDNIFLHPDASQSGGIIMRDDEGIVPNAIKEITKKVAS